MRRDFDVPVLIPGVQPAIGGCALTKFSHYKLKKSITQLENSLLGNTSPVSRAHGGFKVLSNITGIRPLSYWAFVLH